MKIIKYLKHPVTAEEKAKALGDGFKIVDIRFKPEGLKEAEPKEDAPVKTKKTSKDKK